MHTHAVPLTDMLLRAATVPLCSLVTFHGTRTCTLIQAPECVAHLLTHHLDVDTKERKGGREGDGGGEGTDRAFSLFFSFFLCLSLSLSLSLALSDTHTRTLSLSHTACLLPATCADCTSNLNILMTSSGILQPCYVHAVPTTLLP